MTLAVACFQGQVKGEVLFTPVLKGIQISAFFTDLPPGKHGFHIHRAGDLRGEGCKGACDHFHKGRICSHGGPPTKNNKEERHTGDLGNIVQDRSYTFFLKGVRVEELYGRSVIVHEDADDYGKGEFEDSKITGHSGKRIGCAIIGRSSTCEKRKTRKVSK